MEYDPRRLIARLAVAVMVADGRITLPEHEALGRLDELGLGPLSDLAEDEIRRAMRQPIDVPATCEGLAKATPEAAAVIVAALAAIAASDLSVSPCEMDTLNTVAGLLGLTPSETAGIISAVLAEYGATLPQAAGERIYRIPVQTCDGDAADTPCDGAGAVERAYHVLGVNAGVTRGGLDAAYLKLVERYNPANVATLGPEFAALAVRKLVEITAAFETVLGARGGPA